MSWVFHYAPDGVRDWPDRFEINMYRTRWYVENAEGAKVGYFGDGREIWIFAYSRDGLAFEFNAFGLGQTEQLRTLGPKCVIVIDDSIIDAAEDELIVRAALDITNALQGGVLLANLPRPYAGPPIEEFEFMSSYVDEVYREARETVG